MLNDSILALCIDPDIAPQKIRSWLLACDAKCSLVIDHRLAEQNVEFYSELLEIEKSVISKQLESFKSGSRFEVVSNSATLDRIIVIDSNDSQRTLEACTSLLSELELSTINYLSRDYLLHCADPAYVPQALVLDEISYAEAREIADFLDYPLDPIDLDVLEQENISLVLTNLELDYPREFHICPTPNSDSFGVSALVSRKSIGLLSISLNYEVENPALLKSSCFKEIFSILNREDIRIQLISSALADKTLSIALDSSQITKASSSLEAAGFSTVVADTDFSAIAVVGANMRHRAGVSGKIFETLGKNGISVAAIAQSSSEQSISLIVRNHDLEKSLNCLHDVLFRLAKNHLNLMLVGPGTIGRELLEQISTHLSQSDTKNKLRLVAVSNSKTALLDVAGIDLDFWNKKAASVDKDHNIENTINSFIALNLPNSVFIDCTASEQIPQCYNSLIEQSISVVTPNKRGVCDPYSIYSERQALARRHNAKWYYETTVGAGLPIIGTIHDLIASGDKVLKIEAVLSGTLSYLFNSYDTSCTFAQLVRSAQKDGYTEPDPRDDLNGLDVARKLLILARESGHKLDIEQIEVSPPAPPSCFEGSIEDFYDSLEANEEYFSSAYKSALKNNQRLRYIATLVDSSYTVELKPVGVEHPFYELKGTDNILALTTERYSQQPLVVRGPGAGASVTAAGVFADVLRVASFLE